MQCVSPQRWATPVRIYVSRWIPNIQVIRKKAQSPPMFVFNRGEHRTLRISTLNEDCIKSTSFLSQSQSWEKSRLVWIYFFVSRWMCQVVQWMSHYSFHDSHVKAAWRSVSPALWLPTQTPACGFSSQTALSHIPNRIISSGGNRTYVILEPRARPPAVRHKIRMMSAIYITCAN